MPRTVAIGIQDFEKIRNGNYFYIDKTSFIKEWWESGFGRYDVMLEPKNGKNRHLFWNLKYMTVTKKETCWIP